MSTIRQISVFGASGTKSLKYDDNEMHFVDIAFSGGLAESDIVIYLEGTFQYKHTRETLHRRGLAPIPPEAIRRENEIRLALENGRIVCFIGSDAEDYVVSGILESFQIQFSDIYPRNICRGLRIWRSEFKPFLDAVGATTIQFRKNTIDDVICTTKEDHAVGFSKRIGKGLLLYLPCIWGSKETNYIVDLLKKLVKGLVSYSARVILEPPSYLNNFQFADEKVTRAEVNRIKEEELSPLNKKLEYYNKMKSILWLTDDNLVKATNEFLKGLGFQTYVDEINEEDLWIVDNREKRIIIEVKGKSKNLTRQDISKLDEHREARHVPNLTGLLIANTFISANSIETKDTPFPPNVIEKAVNTNVLITRTIDLCRIYDHLERCETETTETLLKIMMAQKGWLTLENDQIKVIS